MLIAVVTVLLFGVPLAFGLTQYLIVEQRRSLEDFASHVAIAVSGDAGLRQLPATANADRNLRSAVYDVRGAYVTGARFPGDVGALVAGAASGGTNTGQLDGQDAIAVPVADGDTVIGVVVAAATNGPLDGRVAIVWGGMLGLAAVSLMGTWLVTRRQAKSLAAPLGVLAVAAERLGDGDFSVFTTPVGIAEIDSVNESVNRTARRLGNMLERERAYAADASHQLRTPLTGLRLQLEAALEDDTADPRAAITDALNSADRLEQTITDLLALARDAPRSHEPLDIAALIAEIQNRWEGPLRAQRRPFLVEVPDINANVSGSSAACTQIVDVLIDNAARHGHGPVSLTVRSWSDAVAIDVSNDGPPIGADRRSQLFQRRSMDATGHGIGLAMGRRLAEAEGGRLRLTADTPTFTLILPAFPVASETEPGERPTMKLAGGSEQR